MPLILASSSPRRRELLASLKIPFQAVAPDFLEISDPSLSPEQEALHFAEQKARSLAKKFPQALIIGSDTVIDCAGEKIGKPRDLAHAMQILRLLRDRTHHILTAVAVLESASGYLVKTIDRVEVQMKNYSDAEIEAYVATEEPLDKAGAYAIQGFGRNLIAAIKGDYHAAVGLGLASLNDLLVNFAKK